MVRHTEYHFIVEGTGKFAAGARPAIGVIAQPGSTIHFEISINLPDGEFFKCSLVAPVKCGADNLIKVFADTATNICNQGWFTPKSIEPTVHKQSLPVALSQNELLAQKIETWFKAVDVEQAGLKRSVNRLNEMIYELEAKREKLLQYLQHLRS